MRIAWMIERKIAGVGCDWIPFKLAGEPGDYVTRGSARKAARDLNDWHILWEYRAAPYLPRMDSKGRRK